MSSKNELFNYGRYQAENTGRDDNGRITEAEHRTYETQDAERTRIRRAIELKRDMKAADCFSLDSLGV